MSDNPSRAGQAELFRQAHPPGSMLSGEVVKIAPFGVFLQLEIDPQTWLGLIQVTELGSLTPDELALGMTLVANVLAYRKTGSQVWLTLKKPQPERRPGDSEFSSS